MIKKIEIENYKIFKEPISINFENHGSQKHQMRFVIEEEKLSTVAGILGKNGSGKTTILDAIKHYAYFTSPHFKSTFIEREFINSTFKNFDRISTPLKVVHEKIDSFMKKNNEEKSSEAIIDAALKNHKKRFNEFAFDSKKNIRISVEFKSNKNTITHNLFLMKNSIKEEFFLNSPNKSIYENIFKIFDFQSQNNKILEKYQMDKFTLTNLNDHEFSDYESNAIQNSHRKDFLEFLKITDETIKDVFYSKKGYITSYIDGRSNKKIDSKFLSQGTKKMIGWFPLFNNSLKTKKALFLIDEIENSLHLSIIKFIITLFKSNYNKKKSQLIFTTHNPLIFENDFKKNSIFLINDNKVIQNKMRYDKRITPGYKKGELISNPDYKYRFAFLKRMFNE